MSGSSKITNAKDAAIDLIRAYVLRGDSIESLKRGLTGSYNDEYHASIGGYMWLDDELKRKLKSDEIGVTELKGKPCLAVFKLKDIFNEIKSQQLRIF